MTSIGITKSYAISAQCIIFLLLLFHFSRIQAQPFQIIFAGSGLSNTVTTVEVQNLTQGTALTLTGSDILELVTSIGVPELAGNNDALLIYPNPAENSCRLEFYNRQTGLVKIELFYASGKLILQHEDYLTQGGHSYDLTGLKSGLYVLKVNTPANTYSVKIISTCFAEGFPLFRYAGRNSPTGQQAKLSSATGTIQMQYNAGERLLFKGNSGNYSRVLTLVPTQSQTVNFEFIACTDVDGNHYPVVTIGTQTWMAGNLKTTKYQNGDPIPVVTDSTTWGGLTTDARCWYNNDSAIFAHTYGAIYNWYAVDNSKGLCPSGWHVPVNDEWDVLSNFLTSSGITGGDLKETGLTHWNSPNTGATNSTAFTALPGGFRYLNTGVFGDIGKQALWLSATASSSTQASAWRLQFLNSIFDSALSNFNYGLSVRCVKGLPLPQALFNTGSTSVYVNDTVCFIDLSKNNPTSWKWYFGDGDSSALQNPCHVYQTPGQYSVTLKVMNVAGSNTLTKSNYINVLTIPVVPPQALFSANDTSVYVNDTVYFTDLSLNNPVSWTWHFGDTNTSTQQNPYHVYSTPGQFTVALIVTNAVGSNNLVKQNYINVSYPAGFYPLYDIDGNGYDTVHIGTQVWMKQNLKTSRLNNGTAIPDITSNTTWTATSLPARCFYNNDSASYYSTYGTLYNWYSVATGNLCPSGWGLPVGVDWKQLSDFLGSSPGGKMKEAGTTHWNSPNTGANNTSGFTALPGGSRSSSNGNYFNTGLTAAFWSADTLDSSSAWNRKLLYNSSNITVSFDYKRFGYSVRCLQNTLPNVTTDSSRRYTSTSVKIYANLINTGGTTNTSHGVCWSTSPNPTITGSHAVVTGGTGNYTYMITGLPLNTTYYVRAYATNSLGTAYGAQLTFTTPVSYVVFDIDGNPYDTVHIGTQVWLKQNLRTTRMDNGNLIPLVTDNNTWTSATTSARCWYWNDSANYGVQNGALYNWYSVNTGVLCPYGYKVPSEMDWQTLETYLGMTTSQLGQIGWRGSQGGMLKETGYSHWYTPNAAASNSTGFTALGGGRRLITGTYQDRLNGGFWWSSSDYQSNPASWYRALGYSNSGIYRGYDGNNNGLSVRCLMN